MNRNAVVPGTDLEGAKELARGSNHSASPSPGAPAPTGGTTPSQPVALSPRWTGREALWAWVLFELAVLGWTAGTLLSLHFSGQPIGGGTPSAPGASVSDALWHLATAGLLAVGAWNRTTSLIAPLMALGLDLDHLPGELGLTVLHRPAHDLLFLGVVVVLLYAVAGRGAALTAGGAVLAHVAVDGGSFPFFSPLTPTRYFLSFPLEVAFALCAALLFYLAVRPLASLWVPVNAARVVGVTLLLAAAIYLLWPAVAAFTQV